MSRATSSRSSNSAIDCRMCGSMHRRSSPRRGWRASRACGGRRSRPRKRACTAVVHSKARDAAAIAHHYDVSNEFYRLVLGPSMTYSCAVWEDDTPSVDVAQTNKYELICRKLGLRPGMRLLDVGCGWGGMALVRGQELRRVGRRCDAVAQAGRVRDRRGQAGRARPSRRDPRPGLPRHRRRYVRRDQLDRHVRARRAGEASASTSIACTRSCGPTAACSTTGSAARGAAARHCPAAASSTATCSPTASCTRWAPSCRACSSRSSRSGTSRACASTTR